jgi:galactose mutarotase-like enzyme
VVPERGGLLTGWQSGGRELLYFDAERFADPAKSVRGGIPVLFPICGNLPGDALVLPQGTFPMAQHGFARDLPWNLEALADGQGLRLTLEDSPTSQAAYPFAFGLVLEYRLEPGALAISATVQHHAGSPSRPDPMPFALGLHPYFAVSALEAAVVQGLPEHCVNHLTMEPAATPEQLQQLAGGIDLLAGPAAGVRLLDQATGQGVELQTTAPLDLAVVWTDPPRPMVCLEPWTAPRGALASGDRCLRLEPGEQLQLQCRYALCSTPTRQA